jgi:SAM-dependent methyltransferase
MCAKSKSALGAVPTHKAYREWVRLVRKEHPPVDMKEYLQQWEVFFDHYATQVEHWRRRNAGYHSTIASLASFYVPSGARVLEVGSGNGDLLAALQPSYGFGVDISGEMVRLARQKYPGLKFLQMPAEGLDLPGEQFDFIVLSDLLGYLYDLRLVFERLRSVCHSRTRLVVHWYSRLWQPVLGLAEKLGLKYPQPVLN